LNTDSTGEVLVTVLMPVYNSARYLREAILSILAQSFGGFELLIMDNASTDASPDIVRSFSDPRIRLVVNERNIGLAASLNRGIRLARGTYIARMDADDIARPDRLKRQVTFMESHPDVGLCGGDMVKIQDGRRYRIRYPRGHESIRVTTLFHAAFPHPAVMMRRQMLLDHSLLYREDLKSLEDFELWSRLVETVRTENLPVVLLDYRCHAAQMSGDYSREIRAIMFDIFRRKLAPLVPDITEQDLSVHLQVSLFHEELDGPGLVSAERWLLCLLEANRTVSLFDPKAMCAVFGRRWIALCGQAAGQGLRTFRYFVSSPLSSGTVFSFASGKLLVKCLLKRANR